MRRAKVFKPKTARGLEFMTLLQERVAGSWEKPIVCDRGFDQLRKDIPCQSSPAKLALLEAVAMTVREDEVYLEIGSFTGASIVAAARARPDLRLIAVDNFSQEGSNPDIFWSNVKRHGVDDRVELRVEDCFQVLRGSLPRVGAYLFDGPHTYLDQYLALELALPHLADGALVVVDDTYWRHVSRANLDFVRCHPQLRMIIDLPSRRTADSGTWWNGLHVFEARPDQPAGNRDWIFQVNRTRDTILRPMDVLSFYYTRLGPVIGPVQRRFRPAAERLRRRLQRVGDRRR